MSHKVLNDDPHALVVHLFAGASIDYGSYYMRLFSAYNVWFRWVTGESTDALGLRAMQRRRQLWDDCFNGDCLEGLVPLMRKLAVLTQHRPLEYSSGRWAGYLSDPYDWTGLIELWYALRCDLVHGSVALRSTHYPVVLRLGYETLSIFMTEVLKRAALTVMTPTLTPGAGIIAPELSEVDLEPARTFKALLEFHDNKR